MKKSFVAYIMALSILLSGCSKSEQGAFLGGTTGALIGSQFGRGDGQVVGTALGAIIGFYIGGRIGEEMDEQDRRRAQQTTYIVLEKSRSGEGRTWRNPDNGHHGYVTAKKAYKDSDDRYCREYTHKVTIGGKTETAYGTACRQEDGSWEVVN